MAVLGDLLWGLIYIHVVKREHQSLCMVAQFGIHEGLERHMHGWLVALLHLCELRETWYEAQATSLMAYATFFYRDGT